MSRVALLGATGVVGRAVARQLAVAGHEVALVGRDGEVLRELADELSVDAASPVSTYVLDPEVSTASLRQAMAGNDVAVAALPVSEGVAGRALAAAIDVRVPLVDTVDAQPHLLHAYDERHADARVAGVSIVPGVGWRTATGDLLAAIAAERVLAPRAVHVAATVPDAGGILRAASSGTRRAIAATLGSPTVAVTGGRRTEELPGEERRLAWFPRPYGPRHAASVPGLEPLSVPRHLPEVDVVRSYVALPSWRAELLQAGANLGRWAPARRRLARRFERGASRRRPSPVRWAVVAEVEGEDGLARGWANGHDADLATALLVVAILDAILAGDVELGVVPPSSAGAPRALLDAVAGASTVRWSVSRPRDEG